MAPDSPPRTHKRLGATWRTLLIALLIVGIVVAVRAVVGEFKCLNDDAKIARICYSSGANEAYGLTVLVACVIGIVGFVLAFGRWRQRLGLTMMLASIAVIIMATIWGLQRIGP